MISLIDASELPEPSQPGAPASAADIAFWKDCFSVLLPPESDEDRKSDEQEG